MLDQVFLYAVFCARHEDPGEGQAGVKNDISQIERLVRTHGNTGLIQKFHEFVDRVENGIERE